MVENVVSDIYRVRINWNIGDTPNSRDLFFARKTDASSFASELRARFPIKWAKSGKDRWSSAGIDLCILTEPMTEKYTTAEGVRLLVESIHGQISESY